VDQRDEVAAVDQDLPIEARPRFQHQILACLLGAIGLYILFAYLAMPTWWGVYERRHPALRSAPGITSTKVGIPADPVNVAFVGAKADLVRTMLAANWHPADPLSLKSSLEIAADTVLRRSYVDAPVSSLYLFGRKEDLAFEKPVGNDPRRRNHVRFWQAPELDALGRPLWLGAATYDRGVGLSRTDGEITHHIDANVDGEREILVNDVMATGRVAEKDIIPNFHVIKQGRNGGGDPWRTDGALWVCVLKTSD